MSTLAPCCSEGFPNNDKAARCETELCVRDSIDPRSDCCGSMCVSGQADAMHMQRRKRAPEEALGTRRTGRAASRWRSDGGADLRRPRLAVGPVSMAGCCTVSLGARTALTVATILHTDPPWISQEKDTAGGRAHLPALDQLGEEDQLAAGHTYASEPHQHEAGGGSDSLACLCGIHLSGCCPEW